LILEKTVTRFVAENESEKVRIEKWSVVEVSQVMWNHCLKLQICIIEDKKIVISTIWIYLSIWLCRSCPLPIGQRTKWDKDIVAWKFWVLNFIVLSFCHFVSTRWHDWNYLYLKTMTHRRSFQSYISSHSIIFIRIGFSALKHAVLVINRAIWY
jgi:hypothetical protein